MTQETEHITDEIHHVDSHVLTAVEELRFANAQAYYWIGVITGAAVATAIQLILSP